MLNRRYLLFVALALTVGATLWLEDEETGPDRQPGRSSQGQRSTALPSNAINPVASSIPPATQRQRAAYNSASTDLFRIGVSPSAAQVLVESPPPIPVASSVTIPFQYLGQQTTHENVFIVFLSYQDKTIAVRENEVIEKMYKVKKISPQSVTLVHLPTHEEMTLDLGSNNR